MIKCLSEATNEPQQTAAAGDLNEFVIKILVQSIVDGLQALEFPYPNPNSNDSRVETIITGLRSNFLIFSRFFKYSNIRFDFN